MKTPFALILTATLLSGCSMIAPQKEDPIITELKGQPMTLVELKLGLPNQRSNTKSGAMVWVYLDRKKGISANECTVTLTIRNETVESVVIDTEYKSLLSSVSESCKHIRKTLDK